jgi:flagellar biosynthesis GTPase FlhF
MRRKNENEYDPIKPNGSGATANLRYGCGNPNVSPSSFTKSSPGLSLTTGLSKKSGKGVNTRKWSPGQAALFKRKKIEGEVTVDDSFGALALSDLNEDADDEPSDYLKQSLDSIKKSELNGKSKMKSNRPDRRPTMPTTTKIKTESPRSRTWGRDLPPSAIVSKPSFLAEESYEGRNKTSTKVRKPPLRSYSTGSDRISMHRYHRRGNRSKSPTHNKYSDKGRMKARSGPKLDQKDLPIEIQQKLYRVTDPDISIKNKVLLELEFMNGTPEEKRIYLEFRSHFDRQEFFDWKGMDEQQKRDNIEANAREESLKEAAFQRSVQLKHEKERQKEEEARERERKAIEKARMHSMETIANAMTDIKNAAIEAATVSVPRNQFQKQCYEDERRQLVEDFRNNEGKDMNDIQRTLKEALIEQEDPEEKRMVLQQRARRPYMK